MPPSSPPRANALAEAVQASWQRARGHRRGGLLAEFGPAAVALLGVVALLLAFMHVVQGAAEHGDQRRKAAAVHSAATWRCRSLRDAAARDACLTRLGRAP